MRRRTTHVILLVLLLAIAAAVLYVSLRGKVGLGGTHTRELRDTANTMELDRPAGLPAYPHLGADPVIQ